MSNQWPDWRLVSCLFLALFTGCTLGPKQIYVGRQQYNEAVQYTLREEMLLNIVRLKYREFPEFFHVGGIVSSYSFGGSLGANLTVPEGAFDVLGLNSGVSRSESPTISYNPKNDPEFQKALLRPTNLATLHLLARTGWNWEHILRTTVQYMNDVENATAAGGPTPSRKPDFEEFQQLAKLFRALQLEDVIEFTHANFSGDPSTLEMSKTLGQLSEDFIWKAHQDGYSFKEVDGRVELVKPTSTKHFAFVIHPQAKASHEMYKIRELLDLGPVDEYSPAPEKHQVSWAFESGWIQSMYAKSSDAEAPYDSRRDGFPELIQPLPPVHHEYGRLAADDIEYTDPPKRDDIVLSTRSFLEILFYLSQAVDVPVEHQAQGLVTFTVDDNGAPFDWSEMLGDMFVVRSCKTRPENAAVAVEYRGYWFYIDERDLDSLGTFTLLQDLYSIEVLTGGNKSPFALTLGVGGGR